MTRSKPSLIGIDSSLDGTNVVGQPRTLKIQRVIESPGKDLVVVCEDQEDGEQYEVPLDELWSLAADSITPAELSTYRFHSRNDIPEKSRARVEAIIEAVSLVHTGDPRCDIYLGGVPDPDLIDPYFDPHSVSLEERIKRMKPRMKAQGIPWSRTSYYRYLEAIQTSDWTQLVHGNSTAVVLAQLRNQYPELNDAIVNFTRSKAQDSNVPKETFQRLAKHKLERDGFDPTEIPNATLIKLLDASYYEYRLDQPFQTRQSKAVPNRGKQGSYRETEPYRTLQIDATPLNLFCLDQKGNVLENVQVVAVICVASRRILTVDFFAGSFGGKELRRLLLRLAQGWVFPNSAGSNVPRLPDRLLIPPDKTQKLGSMGIDRGAQFVARDTIDLVRRLGMDYDIAPQGRGEVKAVIESFFRTLGIIQTALPGYKGTNRFQRSRTAMDQPMLTVDAMTNLIHRWITECYHNQPHSGLRIAGTNRLLTPNQYLAGHIRTMGEVVVDQDLRKLIQLMETSERVVTHHGIQVDGIYYDAYPRSLAELSETHTGRKGQQSGERVRVFHSGYRPKAVLVQTAPGAELVVCAQEGVDTTEPFEDVLIDGYHKMLLEIPSEAEQAGHATKAKDELIREATNLARKRATTSRQTRDAADDDFVEPDILWFDVLEETL